MDIGLCIHRLSLLSARRPADLPSALPNQHPLSAMPQLPALSPLPTPAGPSERHSPSWPPLRFVRRWWSNPWTLPRHPLPRAPIARSSPYAPAPPIHACSAGRGPTTPPPPPRNHRATARRGADRSGQPEPAQRRKWLRVNELRELTNRVGAAAPPPPPPHPLAQDLPAVGSSCRHRIPLMSSNPRYWPQPLTSTC